MSRFDTLLWVGLLLPACGGDGCHRTSDDSQAVDDSQGDICIEVGKDGRCCDSYSDVDDADDDNLSTREECVFGTEPDKPDSDEDFLDDGYEVAQGSDPLEPCSTETPYEGGWSRNSCCDTLEATGNEVGETAANFYGPSQYDETVELYSFCDRKVVLVMSSFDNESTEFPTYGSLYEDLFEKYHDDGLMILLFLTGKADGSVPDEGDVDEIVGDYDLTFPVILDPDAQVQLWSPVTRPGIYVLMGKNLVIEREINAEYVTEGEIVSLLESD